MILFREYPCFCDVAHWSYNVCSGSLCDLRVSTLLHVFSSLLLPQSCQDVDQKNDVCFSVSGATLGFEGSDSQQSQISIVNEVGEID